MSENDIAIAALDRFIAEQTIDRNQTDWKTRLPRPPQAEFDASKRYLWNIATNVGDMVIQLMPDVAPMHVSSTIYLARLGFYDGVIFHRVITGFMAQGGDPLGQGIGGPGYNYDGEYSPSARHDRAGLLSMANAGPGTDGSQFFLTFVADTPPRRQAHHLRRSGRGHGDRAATREARFEQWAHQRGSADAHHHDQRRVAGESCGFALRRRATPFRGRAPSALAFGQSCYARATPSVALLVSRWPSAKAATSSRDPLPGSSGMRRSDAGSTPFARTPNRGSRLRCPAGAARPRARRSGW